MAIKILHCIYALHGGGAERQLTVLANHLDGKELEFAVFCVDASINDIDNQYCQVMTLSDEKNYPWGMIKEVCRVIDEYQPDIVHCWLPPSVSAPALIAARVKGIPAVASYRNKKIFESWIRLPEYICAYFCAKSIVANNPPEQSSYLFRKLFWKKNGVVIPNAVSVDENYRLRRASRDASKAFTFLFVGRLEHQKNWQALLNSLSCMRTEIDWQLLVCGKGQDEEEFTRLALQLGISPNIRMLGYRTDVYNVMIEADLLVLPSWYEGMPNVVLESLSIGVPAVVSAIAAHRFLFDTDSGVLFFDPNKHNQLAAILSDIVNKRVDLEVLSTQGLKFVAEYTPQKLLARFNDYYANVLK